MKHWVILGWLVIWTGHYMKQKGCDATPPPDPYTGQPANYNYAVYCAEDATQKMEHRFDNKDDAEKFMKNCPKGTCTDIKILEEKS